MKIPVLNIRERLTFQFLLLVGVLFMVFSLSIYYFGKLYIENRFFKRLEDRAISASTLALDLKADQQTLLKFVDSKDDQSLVDQFISIYDRDRKLFVLSTNIDKEPEHRAYLPKLDPSQLVNDIKEGDHQMAALNIIDKSGNYAVMVSAIDISGQKALSDLKNILLVLFIVAALCILYLGWYFANKALEPMNNIKLQLSEIFPKNLSRRIILKNSDDEIGILAQTINDMLKRAENVSANQKLFVANISHELKNPLTKIYTQIELLEMKYTKDKELSKNIISIRQDAKKLNELTASMLNLANSYTSEAEITKQKIRIDEVLLDAISEYKTWNSEDKIEIKWPIIPDDEVEMQIQGNTDALKVVFKNLISNAHKFSDNKAVEITLLLNKNRKIVSFKNQSPTIPADQLEKIFEPFYRSDSTALGKEGHGIGLAVVKQILQLHNAKINLSSANNEVVFEVVF